QVRLDPGLIEFGRLSPDGNVLALATRSLPGERQPGNADAKMFLRYYSLQTGKANGKTAFPSGALNVIEWVSSDRLKVIVSSWDEASRSVVHKRYLCGVGEEQPTEDPSAEGVDTILKAYQKRVEA